MRNVIEYQILSSPSVKGLEEAVNDALKLGWQPFGGVAYDNSEEEGDWVSQVIVKYEE